MNYNLISKLLGYPDKHITGIKYKGNFTQNINSNHFYFHGTVVRAMLGH